MINSQLVGIRRFEVGKFLDRLCAFLDFDLAVSGLDLLLKLPFLGSIHFFGKAKRKTLSFLSLRQLLVRCDLPDIPVRTDMERPDILVCLRALARKWLQHDSGLGLVQVA